jgi:hypothetical protein
MSNPLLVQGSQIPDFSGDSNVPRTFVTSISFNDSSLQVINAEGKVDDDLDPKASVAATRKTLLVSSIRIAEDKSSLQKCTENAVKYTPPFMNKDIYTKEKTGLMFTGSASILSNGVMIPTPLIPDRPEVVNNIMEYNQQYPGTAGASAQNAPWVWKARRITKTEQGDNFVTNYGAYLEPKNFDTNNGAGEEQWAATYVNKKGTQVEVKTHPNDDQNAGISLELDTSDLIKINKLGETTPAGNSGASKFDTNGTFEGARLGAFMLLLNLQPDDKRSGEDINKTLPWDVTIRMGDAVNAASNFDDASKIQIKMTKGSQVQVDVYGERTTFNLPAPPVSNASQPAGEQDPNTIAISVIPVLNGINVSVGNFSGLDKKVSNRMSQFCVSNPYLNVTGLYNRNVNPEYPNSEPDDPDASSDLFSTDDSGPAPSIIIQSTTDPDDTCKQGLIAIGDQLSVDLFNVVGKVAYIPLFFHTKTDMTLLEPIATDVSTEAVGDSNLKYYYWPLWCKNGMDAVMKNFTAKTLTFENEQIQAPIGAYQQTPLTSGGSTATVTIIGVNPFVAGDTVEISGLETSSGNGTHTVTLATTGTIQFEVDNETAVSEGAINAVAKLQGSRSGKVLAFRLRTIQGRRTPYDTDEEDPDVKTRYDAVVGRLNECLFPRYPILIYGAIKVQKEDVDLDAIHNNNTPLFDLGGDWINCITNIQVSHALEGTSGSMTIDRHALTQIYMDEGADDYLKNSDFGIQQVGQVAFDIEMTKSGRDTEGESKYAFRLGRDSESNKGTLIKGFAYGFGIEQNSGSATLKVPLYGINRKLEEMKLYNAPFFDGETVERTVNFLCGWGNVERNLEFTNEEERLSASSVLGEVRHEFKLGTPLWSALQEVADDTANYIVVQPDAKVYVYKINQFGEPEHPDFTPKNWEYPTARVLNLSRNPDFSQFYNKLIVTALQNNAAATGGSTDNNNPLDNAENSDELPLFPIAVGVDLTDQSIPHIPWEKLVVKPLQSFWTQASLSKYAKILAKQSLSVYYTGSTSIPGNLGVRLWDKFNTDYWITGISHNFDITSKKFTTDLTLAVLRPAGTITENSSTGDITITPPEDPVEPYDP